MKILYGVQATGNGHITRTRVIAPKLAQAGAQVDYLFTGRERTQLFEMEAFGAYQWRRGLTFGTKGGQVRMVRTVFANKPGQFLRDIRSLDLNGYDLVISDFEPVTAWAARRRGIRTVGVSHQYAFGYDIPRAGGDALGLRILDKFAPVSLGLGVHWHHFDQPIIPPVIEPGITGVPIQPDKYIVYLPFENIDKVSQLLRQFQRYRFVVYSPAITTDQAVPADNIVLRKPSHHGFRQDFASAAGVICNAGFELPSEALQAGKKLLVKPLRGQIEQRSNALALERLGYGQVMQVLDYGAVAAWLKREGEAVRITFPDVAQAVADWILSGAEKIDPNWVRGIWERTVVGKAGGG